MASAGGLPATRACSDGFSPETIPPEVFLAGYLARIRFFDGAPARDDTTGGGGGGRQQSDPNDCRGVGVIPPATAATLARLQAAHVLALPFENLSVFSTRRMANTLDAAWVKMVAGRRGGWCLEHNALLAGVCRVLGYPAVTPRVGWVLPDPSVATLLALFGGTEAGASAADGDASDAAAAHGPTPPRHLVVEVEVAAAGGAGGGVSATPARSFLLDAGNGRAFGTPLLLRGRNDTRDGGDGAVGAPVCQPDGVWWRVVPLVDVLTAAGVSPALRTLPGAADDFRVVQWATPPPRDGATVGGDRGGVVVNGNDSAGGGATGTVDGPLGGAAPGVSSLLPDDAAWNCLYVFDAVRVVGALSDLDRVRDYYQDAPDSLFRRRRLLTRPVDGGRRLLVLADGALRVGTSAGTGGEDAAAATTVVSGGEAGWLATVADRFDVVLSEEEAARLAAEMPLPPAEEGAGQER